MVAPVFGEHGVIGTMTVGNRLGDVNTFELDELITTVYNLSSARAHR